MHRKYTWWRKKVGSPKSSSLLSSFHIGSMLFLASQFCHPHSQKRKTLFGRYKKRHSQLETFPNRAAMGFSQIAFPIVLPKEYCIRPRIVFCNITSEHNSTFVIFAGSNSVFLKLHLSISEAKWTIAPVVSGSTPTFSPIFPFLVHRCFCCRTLPYGLLDN